LTDVPAHITGTVWKIEKKPGDAVSAGDVLVILESMKMEMPVEAPCGGTVREIKIKEGEAVDEGKVLAVIDEA
jgi:acetyl-CoA carboxylase biotin carboxyl carrier protein